MPVNLFVVRQRLPLARASRWRLLQGLPVWPNKAHHSSSLAEAPGRNGTVNCFTGKHRACAYLHASLSHACTGPRRDCSEEGLAQGRADTVHWLTYHTQASACLPEALCSACVAKDRRTRTASVHLCQLGTRTHRTLSVQTTASSSDSKATRWPHVR